MDCTAALAVPLILCVKGEVALICKTVTMPMENPKKPATIMAAQKGAENNCPLAQDAIKGSASKAIMRGMNMMEALTLL